LVRAARGGARTQAPARRVAIAGGQPGGRRLPALLRDALPQASLPIRYPRYRGIDLPAGTFSSRGVSRAPLFARASRPLRGRGRRSRPGAAAREQAFRRASERTGRGAAAARRGTASIAAARCEKLAKAQTHLV